MGACAADALYPLENGIAIPATYFDKFLTDRLGAAVPDKTREQIKINFKRLGFLERIKGKPDRLTRVVPQENIIHDTKFSIIFFARKSVRTVELRTPARESILENI